MQSIVTVSYFVYTAVVFREVSSTGLRKLLLAIEIHMSVCGLQATHRPTIVAGLHRQSWLIKMSLLGGVWMANDGLLLEAGGASFVNFVKLEDFGGY